MLVFEGIGLALTFEPDSGSTCAERGPEDGWLDGFEFLLLSVPAMF
jgi:hypothetical protein